MFRILYITFLNGYMTIFSLFRISPDGCFNRLIIYCLNNNELDRTDNWSEGLPHYIMARIPTTHFKTLPCVFKRQEVCVKTHTHTHSYYIYDNRND